MSQSWSREHFLYLPPILAALSLAYVFLKWQKAFRRPWSDLLNGQAPAPVDSRSAADPLKHPAADKKALDGTTITVFRFIKLLCIIVLLSLEVYELSIGQGPNALFYRLPFYVYVSLLAISSIIASPRWRDIASRQLAFLLFTDFVVYLILDVWPYATMTPTPFDPASDPTTWARLVLLALGGLVVPLIMPRPFRALTPGAQPSLEDTASLLSRYTYSFLDDIVFYAFRVPDITIKDMPQMPERKKISVLSKSAFAALDPTRVGKRHVIWGVFRIWGKEYALLTAWMSMYCVAEFAGPYGLRNLLEYLETGVSPHNLRAWVWIIVLTVGPVISACFFTQFLYVSTHIVVENSSVFTYLVFHHALRIRLKSNLLLNENDKAKEENGRSTNGSTPASTTPTAADEEPVPGSGGDQTPCIADADAVTASTSVGGAEQTAKSGHASEKTEQLIGKINNLITTDLAAAANFLYVVTMPTAILQVVISIVFLSPVGFIVMLVFFPAPAYIAKLIAKVQRGRMTVTDKRVQSITESLGVLRMIKLFAWEPFILKQLAHNRNEELSRMLHFRLLEAGMDTANQILPLLSKLVVLSIYTLVMKGDLTGE
ncbi:hypothetical protein M0805_008725 [Coniferiporia weirii]|nr:hypothetical protein M0805_008725 [Coniferiporia weirii]